MITIENDTLKANINFRGAELSSLKNKKTKVEYIWQADPVHWARHAPILFPVVGRLRDDRYIHNEQTFFMSQHGFARDLEFELLSSNPNGARLLLKADMSTRITYPFKFELFMTYSLKGNELIIDYEVHNKSKETMYFSLGSHPGFNCPLLPEEKRSDYHLEFEKKENASIHLLEGGLRSGEKKVFLKDQNLIPFSDSLFDQDALIFHQLKSESVSICKDNKKILTVKFKGFPWLGIWSKRAESPFVCIEPWHGVADTVDHNKHLEQKEGIIKLNASAEWKTNYSIIVE